MEKHINGWFVLEDEHGLYRLLSRPITSDYRVITEALTMTSYTAEFIARMPGIFSTCYKFFMNEYDREKVPADFVKKLDYLLMDAYPYYEQIIAEGHVGDDALDPPKPDSYL